VKKAHLIVGFLLRRIEYLDRDYCDDPQQRLLYQRHA